MNTIDIHGKPYVMVKDRVIHFNGEYPNGCIRSKLVDRINNIVIFEAKVIPDVDKPERYFTGHAEEEIGSSQINKTSALENCETSAVGRALAMMGIGADESFASADEVANAVFQQNEEDATGVSYQNTPKTAENGLKCPDCSSGIKDGRSIEGGLKPSAKAKKLMDDGHKVDLSASGMHQSAFQCLNKQCKFVVWSETDISKTKIINMNEPAPHNKEYTPEQLNELDFIENGQKTNEEIFNEI